MKNPFKKKEANTEELYKDVASTLKNFDTLVENEVASPDYKNGVVYVPEAVLEGKSKGFIRNFAMRAWVYVTLRGEVEHEVVTVVGSKTGKELARFNKNQAK